MILTTEEKHTEKAVNKRTRVSMMEKRIFCPFFLFSYPDDFSGIPPPWGHVPLFSFPTEGTPLAHPLLKRKTKHSLVPSHGPP